MENVLQAPDSVQEKYDVFPEFFTLREGGVISICFDVLFYNSWSMVPSATGRYGEKPDSERPRWACHPNAIAPFPYDTHFGPHCLKAPRSLPSLDAELSDPRRTLTRTTGPDQCSLSAAYRTQTPNSPEANSGTTLKRMNGTGEGRGNLGGLSGQFRFYDESDPHCGSQSVQTTAR